MENMDKMKKNISNIETHGSNTMVSDLHLDVVSDALQAANLIGHLNGHVQGELSEGGVINTALNYTHSNAYYIKQCRERSQW